MILSLVLGVITLSACSDDNDYTVGSQTNADSLNVYFTSGANVVLPSDSNTFKVTVTRNNTSGALTVPLNLSSSNGYDANGTKVFSAPSQVEFKAGEATSTILVQATDSIKMFNSYHVILSVPEEYTTQYKSTQAGQPRAELNIVKEDYKNYAKGSYFSYFFGDPYTEDAVLQHSALKDTYRFSNVASGETFTFQVGTDNKISYDWTKLSNGYTHKKYGAMYISPSSSKDYPSYFSPEENTYYFGFEFIVSAGSFGDSYEGFIVTNKL